MRGMDVREVGSGAVRVKRGLAKFHEKETKFQLNPIILVAAFSSFRVFFLNI